MSQEKSIQKTEESFVNPSSKTLPRLEEIEITFENRYSDQDKIFKSFCEQRSGAKIPPILENWADVSDEIELQNFKAICEIESAIPASNFIVLFNQSPLIDQSKSLKDYGIRNGDCVVLEKSQNYDPGTLPNLNELAELASNPSLDIDHERLNKYLELQKNLSADPYSLEAQRLIAEEIEAQNINANLSSAYEYNPESFASVCMLYVNCKFNGHPIKAFVDSGAQTTVMSAVCAERCGLSRLIDKRYSGICHGIGVKRIVGKIHMVQLQIENDFLVNSITIIEDNIMDCLIGLDLLKRHQCCIDLKTGILRIGTTGTETKFLPENEIPKHNEESFEKKVSLELVGAGPSEIKSTSSSATASAPAPTSAMPTSTVTSATQLTILPGDNFTENDIKTITDSQFSRAEAIAELRKQNGNCNKALAVLFAKSLKF